MLQLVRFYRNRWNKNSCFKQVNHLLIRVSMLLSIITTLQLPPSVQPCIYLFTFRSWITDTSPPIYLNNVWPLTAYNIKLFQLFDFTIIRVVIDIEKDDATCVSHFRSHNGFSITSSRRPPCATSRIANNRLNINFIMVGEPCSSKIHRTRRVYTEPTACKLRLS